MANSEVECASDYESKSRVKRIAAQTGRQYPDMADKFKAIELRAEHQRLKDAVVEKVKEWRELRLMQAGTRRTIGELMDVLDSLLWFERKHNTE
jgi:hypothetical protein